MAQPPQQLLSNFAYRFNQLPASRKMGLAAVLAASIALLVGLYLWSSTPDYRVLYSNLSEKDAGSVTAALQQMNVPYQTEAGGTVMVPAGQVYDLRFRMAAQGLPKGGAVGFEILDNPKLGMTQFQEQVAYQRGLEGELSRSIQSLSPVDTARVHLAIPKPSVFIRDKQMPSASVLVKLHPGRALDGGQVQSIVHLVSSSVPELTPSNITVVDQTGNLLTGRGEGLQGLDPSQLDYLREVETYYSRRIEAIVSPIVGDGNVKAEVRADLDFSVNEATSETFKPNSTPAEQSIRSQQSVDDSSTGGNQAQGVPGALTNQPPGPATAPFNAPAGANAGQNTQAGGAGGNSSRRENTVNFEVDKTITHTKLPLGRVKRLSVAVVVNYKAGQAAENQPAAKPEPLTPQELTQINNLVKEAMGFSQPRGDTLNVVNAAFTENRIESDTSLWKDPSNLAMAKSLLKNLIVLGLAFYLVFGVLRPLLRDMVKPPEKPAHDPYSALHEAALMEGVEASNTYGEILSEVKTFAKSNPKVTADIVKEWVNKE